MLPMTLVTPPRISPEAKRAAPVATPPKADASSIVCSAAYPASSPKISPIPPDMVEREESTDCISSSILFSASEMAFLSTFPSLPLTALRSLFQSSRIALNGLRDLISFSRRLIASWYSFTFSGVQVDVLTSLALTWSSSKTGRDFLSRSENMAVHKSESFNSSNEIADKAFFLSFSS